MSAYSTILLAEDEPNDAFFIRWGFEKAGCSHTISHVHDGQEALDYLNGEEQFADRSQFPKPDLLLLDLKMPRLTGFDVLEWLKNRPEFSNLPVVVFSSSDHQSDMDRAISLGAKGYRIKPNEIEKFVSLAKDLTSEWLRQRPIAAA
jgi:CheY-like chemotaxis protein